VSIAELKVVKGKEPTERTRKLGAAKFEEGNDGKKCIPKTSRQWGETGEFTWKLWG